MTLWDIVSIYLVRYTASHLLPVALTLWPLLMDSLITASLALVQRGSEQLRGQPAGHYSIRRVYFPQQICIQFYSIPMLTIHYQCRNQLCSCPTHKAALCLHQPLTASFMCCVQTLAAHFTAAVTNFEELPASSSGPSSVWLTTMTHHTCYKSRTLCIHLSQSLKNVLAKAKSRLT